MKYFLYITVFSFFINSCGPNALSGLGSQTSDDFYMEEATKANNSQNYDYALDVLLNKLSATGRAAVPAVELLASAYAGKCGFNFVQYVDSLSQSSSTAVFNVMMQPFVQVATDPSYCLLALQTIDTLGAPGIRTANQNTFSAITGLVLMGASTRAYADKDGTGNNGSGTMDSVDMICDNTLVTDNQMNDIIVGYGYFVTNLAYVSASMLGSSSFNGLNDSVAACNSVPGADCTITDKNNVSAGTRLAIRRLLNTSTYGIGNRSGATPADLLLACP
ncbi:hypothetical protein CIK05_12835 [Bdellovibrio sp. qaytius]|nr:hypothetical protein CIK05_12835 [Bdellovibrio sp. qaytius]